MRRQDALAQRLQFVPPMEDWSRGHISGRHCRPLVADERGVVFAEYVVVLTLVSLVGSAAVVALGVPLVRAFRFAQLFIALPIP